MNRLLESALHYAELGYAVFPCRPDGKAPATAHGFHDASSDPQQIRDWWQAMPGANIGLATRGLVVIDIDGDSWPSDPTQKASLAEAAAIQHTPRGGRHYIYRRPPHVVWRDSVGQLATGVDTRTDGGYIIVAPSRIGRGHYRWEDGRALVPVSQLTVPPPWLCAMLDAMTAAPVASNGRRRTDSRYIDDGNPIPKGVRNRTLTRLAGKMRQVGMTRAEIEAALHTVNRQRCQPPLSDAEVARTAASVASYRPDQITTAHVEDHYEQMMMAADEASESAEPQPLTLPTDWLRVPGLVGEVTDYILASAPYPEPTLAFSAALALQSVLCGRRIRSEGDTRPNIYAIALANSGAGKERPRQVIAEILHAAGLDDHLGMSFASGEGIEDRMLGAASMLFLVDEFDGLIRRVGGPKDARHENIMSILLTMYSASSAIYTARAKAGQQRAVIHQPHLCLLGSAVPRQFYSALNPRMLTNGFLARFLVFEAGRRGDGQDAQPIHIPASIVAAARWWATFRPGSDHYNLADWVPQPIIVPRTSDAREAMRQTRHEADQRYRACEEHQDDIGMAVWARALEKIDRLTLLWAASADRESPVVTAEAVEWAKRLVFALSERMLAMAAHYASESDFAQRCEQIIALLRRWQTEHGDRPMPFWMIARSLRWSSREHEEVRDALVAQHRITVCATNTASRGRHGMAYRITEG